MNNYTFTETDTNTESTQNLHGYMISLTWLIGLFALLWLIGECAV